jgi:hypothetical protein
MVASKKWDKAQSDKEAEESNNLTIDQLKDRYLKYMKTAADNTEDIHIKFNDNRINILNLENNRKSWGRICIILQSLGLFLGFIAIYLEKT